MEKREMEEKPEARIGGKAPKKLLGYTDFIYLNLQRIYAGACVIWKKSTRQKVRAPNTITIL